jgi:hypothetical protein
MNFFKHLQLLRWISPAQLDICMLLLQFKDRSTANNVEVILPLPPDAITPIVKTSTGAAV